MYALSLLRATVRQVGWSSSVQRARNSLALGQRRWISTTSRLAYPSSQEFPPGLDPKSILESIKKSSLETGAKIKIEREQLKELEKQMFPKGSEPNFELFFQHPTVQTAIQHDPDMAERIKAWAAGKKTPDHLKTINTSLRPYDKEFFAYFPELRPEVDDDDSELDFLEEQLDEANEELSKDDDLVEILEDQGLLEDVDQTEEEETDEGKSPEQVMKEKSYAVHAGRVYSHKFDTQDGFSVTEGVVVEFANKTFNQYFQGKFVPPSIVKYMKQMHKYQAFIDRPQYQYIVDLLRSKAGNFFSGDDGKGIVLIGPPGSGKTTALLVTAAWARANEWLCLYIPDGKFLTGHGVLRPSRVMPGYLDQPELAQEILRDFILMHGKQLQTLPLNTTFSLPGFNTARDSRLDKETQFQVKLLTIREQEQDTLLRLAHEKELQRQDQLNVWGQPEEGEHPHSTLYDLCLFGARSSNLLYATDAFYHLRRELSAVTKFPVLIAVDGFNYVTGDSCYHDPYSRSFGLKPLESTRLTITNLISDIKSPGMANGVIIGALTGTRHQASYFEKYGLDVSFKIPAFNYLETDCVFALAERCGFVGSVTKPTRAFVHHLSGGRAGELMNQMEKVAWSSEKESDQNEGEGEGVDEAKGERSDSQATQEEAVEEKKKPSKKKKF